MKNRFLPYGLCLLMRKMDYNEEAFATYRSTHEIDFHSKTEMNNNIIPKNDVWRDDCSWCSAITWLEALDWFENEFDLMSHYTTHLNPIGGEDGALDHSYGWRIMLDKDGYKCEVWEDLARFETKNEALLSLVKKLLEISSEM